MTTEERLTALESDRTILNRIASEQLLRLRDLEHNVTILVGAEGSQGQDIKAIKKDVSDIRERLEYVESRLERMEGHFDERLDAIVTLLQKLQPPSH